MATVQALGPQRRAIRGHDWFPQSQDEGVRTQVLQQLRSAMAEVDDVEAPRGLRDLPIRWAGGWLVATAALVAGLAIGGRWDVARWWSRLQWWAPISVVLTVVVVVAWAGWSLYVSGVCVSLLRKSSSPRWSVVALMVGTLGLYVAIGALAVVIPGVLLP